MTVLYEYINILNILNLITLVIILSSPLEIPLKQLSIEYLKHLKY